MSSSTTPALASPSEGSHQRMTSNPNQHQNQSLLHGNVAILWDIENCPVPSDVRPEDVAGNIRMALRVHPVIDGAVTMFSAYGDFSAFPRRLREGCQRTGVKLIDVPNGRKDAADKAILIDLFLFALDNPPPSSIMLISGDVDFAPALHILGQRGYAVVLVIPSGNGVSPALCNAGRFVWDWPIAARGEGFVTPVKSLREATALLRGCQVNDGAEGQIKEESIVYRGNTREVSVVSLSLSDNTSTSTSKLPNPTAARSHGLPHGLSQVCEEDDLIRVKPGDVNGLKGQLVKLLELSGGNLPLTRLRAEYKKIYGRPLYVSQYGAVKLVNLLEKMVDAISVEGEGGNKKKTVCLLNSKNDSAGPTPTVTLGRQEKKGKPAQEVSSGVMGGGAASSDELSEEERMATQGNGGKREGGAKFNFEVNRLRISLHISREQSPSEI